MMTPKESSMQRRTFLKSTSALAGALLLYPGAPTFAAKKKKIALVGTGVRGTGTWGRNLTQNYSDYVEFVGLCDINPGRLAYGKKYIGVDCPTFTNFEEMVNKTKPEMIIVTTVDATHHEFIIKGMEMGCDVVTEKPMTTDEIKCQKIIDTERKTGKKTVVTFNYRYSPHRQKIKELLLEERIGKLTSVDFHWYLDIYHGAAYFRRWHGLRDKSGTLLVHKATHHFDLLNWWIDSDPEKVHAFGDLEFYGKNNDYRHVHCRACPHQKKCKFYWDITKDKRCMDLYVNNEQHDGYIRDSCVWRNDIDIYDKMAVQIKYANKVQVAYSLTTYSPYEGYRIAFNGTKGRLEAWIQERQPWPKQDYDEIRVTDNFGETELIRIPIDGGGHGGGDSRLLNKIFKDPNAPDPWSQAAGPRDGAMSILIGIAARNSIENGGPVQIADLTDLQPLIKRKH